MKKYFFFKNILLLTIIFTLVFPFGVLVPNKVAQATFPVIDYSDQPADEGSWIENIADVVSNTGSFIAEKSMDLKEWVLDGVAKAAAQAIIRQITVSIVEWINNGFEGKPGFLQDPQGLFVQTLNEEIGRFIEGSELGWLCDPYSLDIKISLSKSFMNYRPAKCTLTNIIQNAQSFKADTYRNMQDAIMNPQENYVGSWMQAENQLTVRFMGRNAKDKKVLDWGSGFMSWTSCDKYEAAQCLDEQDASSAVASEGDNSSWAARERDRAEYNAEQQASSNGCKNMKPKQCAEGANTIKTPGTVIQKQLQDVTGTDLWGLQFADEINEILVALAGQLIKKVMSSAGGLFGAGSSSGTGNSSYVANLSADTASAQQAAMEQSMQDYEALQQQIANDIQQQQQSAIGKNLQTVNLALTSKASQSQDATLNETAELAIDGLKNTYSHTNSMLKPWWQIDLGKNYQITKINIWKPVSIPPDTSLGHFRIVVANGNGMVSWTSPEIIATAEDLQSLDSSLIDPNLKIIGRIVRIERLEETPQTIQLSEVEVYGIPQ
ncbi:MAG: discoidin domain-containing protein [bacterium]